jgi:TonB family protein
MMTCHANQTMGVLALVLGIWATTAIADNRSDFDQAYATYNQYVTANETELALSAAKDSLRYGTKVFGKSHVNTANLAINYAKLLNDTGDHKQARKALKDKLTILEERYGSEASKLVPMVIELARSAKKPVDAFEYLRRAGDLANGYEDDLIEAQKNFDIMVILLGWGGASLTEPFVDRAHEIYSEKLQPTDFRLGFMSYHKARWAMMKGQYEDAPGYLQGALTALKSPVGQPLGDLERTIRMQLVEVHERLKQPQVATENLLVLGAKGVWSNPAEPVFKTEADLPVELVKQRLEGDVVMSFTVDEQGFVVNPSVLESNQETLDEAALTMVQRFRYAPRFIDGRAVSTDGVKYTASFEPSAAPQSVATTGKLTRPAIREMMMPDRNDTSQCFDGGLGSAAKSCNDLPSFK